MSSLAEKVKEAVKEAEKSVPHWEHVRRAERLSDKFKDVRPETYSVPIERFAGLPSRPK